MANSESRLPRLPRRDARQKRTMDARSVRVRHSLFQRERSFLSGGGCGVEFAARSHLRPDFLKCRERAGIKQNEMNFLERCGTLQMVDHFAQHDLGAFRKRKAGNPGTDRGKRDGAKLPFGCDSQAMRYRRTQRARRSFSSQLHAGRVNHVARAKLASRADRRAADRYTADSVAFPLNRFAALATDCARNSST